MIPTLNKLAHSIRDNLSGGQTTVDSSMDIRDIVIFIREAMSTVMKLSVYERMQAGDRGHITLYIATFPAVEIETDDIEKYKYIILPSIYVNLPHNKGIYALHPAENPSVTIIRMNNPYVTMNTRSEFMEGLPSYYTEGLKCIFSEKNFKKAWKKVIPKLVIPGPESIGLDDPLPMVSDQIAQVKDQVTQRIQVQLNIPTDDIVDGTKNLRSDG